MDDSFYGTMKMITGEEVLSEIVYIDEDGNPYYLLHNPIVIQEFTQFDSRKGGMVTGMIPKKWMNFANDNMTIVYKNHVLSVSELDKFGADFYEKALIAAKIMAPIKKKVSTSDNTGFVGNIDSYRDKLEKMFNAE